MIETIKSMVDLHLAGHYKRNCPLNPRTLPRKEEQCQVHQRDIIKIEGYSVNQGYGNSKVCELFSMDLSIQSNDVICIP